MCYSIQAWHVAAEMQMFLIELLVLMIVNKRPRDTGVVLAGTFVLTNVVQIWYTYKNRLIGIYLAGLE